MTLMRRVPARFLWVLAAVALLGSCSLVAAEAEQALLNDDAPVLDIREEPECESTTDCFAFGLKDTICRNSVCMEDKLFPLSDHEIAGSIGAFIAGVLSAGSGLGGGGLLVPLYILLMGLSSHEAIPLSKATIFGSAIASFIINVRSRHPLSRDRPLIDYETMLMMEPMTLAGTIIGVNMNAVFPEWLITVCIVWLLSKTSIRTFSKGIKMWKEESAADTKRLEDVVSYWKLLPYESKFKEFQVVALAYLKWKAYKRPALDLKLKVSNPQESELSSVASTVDTEEDNSSSDNEDESLINSGVKKTMIVSGPVRSVDELTELHNRIPYGDLSVLFLTWIGLVLFSMAKGGHGSPSVVGLTCGSFAYWLLIALSFPFFAGATLYFGVKICKFHMHLQAAGYKYLKGDMVWTKEAVTKYPVVCTLAGLAAGLLGIGGGMVKGPLLIEMGLHPQVASATSSSMILFTSSATTIQFIILGTLSVEHALWHGMVGFISGIVGQLGMSYLIRKYRKAAFVILLIAAVVGVSGGIMGVLGTRRIFEVGIGGFRSLCIA
uniref:Membrane transporter protein n=1 Tax=Globisporangium ultimum (strain ATCC 200006 / CBS 805.95 / DAOM BR144) TaxID=431595 RepID=K3W6R7_GLOUD